MFLTYDQSQNNLNFINTFLVTKFYSVYENFKRHQSVSLLSIVCIWILSHFPPLDTVPETLPYRGVVDRHHLVDDDLPRLEDGREVQ